MLFVFCRVLRNGRRISLFSLMLNDGDVCDRGSVSLVHLFTRNLYNVYKPCSIRSNIVTGGCR